MSTKSPNGSGANLSSDCLSSSTIPKDLFELGYVDCTATGFSITSNNIDATPIALLASRKKFQTLSSIPPHRPRRVQTTPPPPCPTRATIDRALEIQNRVKQRTSGQTWAIFWEVTIENQALGDVARKYSMRYASAFAAVSRVHKMLKEEALKLQETAR